MEEGGEAGLAWWIYSFRWTWRDGREREGGQDVLLPRKQEEAATVAGFALGFGAPSLLPDSGMGPLLVTGRQCLALGKRLGPTCQQLEKRAPVGSYPLPDPIPIHPSSYTSECPQLQLTPLPVLRSLGTPETSVGEEGGDHPSSSPASPQGRG